MFVKCPICRKEFKSQGFHRHWKAETEKLAREFQEKRKNKGDDPMVQNSNGNPEMCNTKHWFTGEGSYCQDCGHLFSADCHFHPADIPDPAPAPEFKIAGLKPPELLQIAE